MEDLLYKSNIVDGYFLKAKHPVLRNLQMKAGKIFADDYAIDTDDILQEVACIMLELNIGMNDMDSVRAALYDETSIISAKYWTYIQTAVIRILRRQKQVDNIIKSEQENGVKLSYMLRQDALENVGDNIESEEVGHFQRWFVSNEKILTSKQRKFISTNGVGYNRRLAWKYRNNISKRILTAYQEQFHLDDYKLNENKDKLHKLQSIKTQQDLKALMNDKYIIDLFYFKDTPKYILQELTKLYRQDTYVIPVAHYKYILSTIEAAKSKLIELCNKVD